MCVKRVQAGVFDTANNSSKSSPSEQSASAIEATLWLLGQEKNERKKGTKPTFEYTNQVPQRTLLFQESKHTDSSH